MPSYRLSGTVDRSAWKERYPRLTAHQVQAVATALIEALGDDAVIQDPSLLLAYSYDATGERHWPDLAVLPRTAQEVSQVLACAHRYRLPIIARGASTNLSGGTTPLVGGLVVSLARMNQILEINATERWVRLQPGVVNAELGEALRPWGLFYPPDPSSHRISTIGGNIAENSGGPHCVKYGVTTHHVLQLTVALADGQLVSLPRVADTNGGIDIASVMIGSEGTLGLVTEAVLGLEPMPAKAQTLLASFRALGDAVRAVSAIIARGVEPAALELMDRPSIEIVEAFVHAGYPHDADAVLLIELDGSEGQIRRGVAEVQAVLEAFSPIGLRIAQTEAEAQALWKGRRGHYGASARVAPHLWVQDVTVPRPRLAEMMDEVVAISEREGIPIFTAAHAGDGNLHPVIPYDPRNPDQVRHMKAADRAILEACVSLGGSITGEHGVGIDKAEHLPLMYSDWELEAMAEVKTAFDPDGVLNPLKALWPAKDGLAVPSPPEAPQTIGSVAEIQDAMAWARAHSQLLSIRGGGRRSRTEPLTDWTLSITALDAIDEVDASNLSVTVGAGCPAGTLARVLQSEGLDIPGLEPFMDDTVGGLIASNAFFWRHAGDHGWRDWILGVEWVDARGRLLRFGTKTMKNVAGYDLAKLLVGSRGRLGALTRVILRARPRRETLWVAESGPLPVDLAWPAAARVLQRPDRPDGILLCKRPGQSLVSVWCVGNLDSERLRQALKNDVPGDWIFVEGRERWLTLERERLTHVYQAHAAGTIQTGWLGLGHDPSELLAASGMVCLCPARGWYEMMEGPPASPQDNDFVMRLRERVARVFDPDHILC